MPLNAASQFKPAILLPIFAISMLGCDKSIEPIDNNYLECGEQLEWLDNRIDIRFEGGGATVNNPYSNEFAIALYGENVIAQNLSRGEEYNLTISGATENGSIKIYGNHRMGLYLNGASISSQNRPAINIQNLQRTSVHLAEGTENYIADGADYEDAANGEDAKGTFFSEGQVSFSGCGSLEVAGRHSHAIAVDSDIEFAGGRITVSEAARDGIHANGEIHIKGGIISISSEGDAIQSEQSEGLPMRISGGKITAKTAGANAHGIKADGDMEISGGALDISALGERSKGIRARGNLVIYGGDVNVKANDDGIKVHGDLYVSEENANVCAWSLKKDGIDCNGTETIANAITKGSKCANGF